MLLINFIRLNIQLLRKKEKRKWRRRGLALTGALGLSAVSTYVAGKGFRSFRRGF